MKNLFVEPYDPLQTFPLQIDENRFGWPFIGVSLFALAIIGASLFSFPESLAALAFLILPLMIVGFTAEECGMSVMYPIRKKRSQEIYTTDYRYPWYSRKAAEQDPIYKEKLMEYLEYCRAGGEPNKIVQRHLSEWLADAEQGIKMRQQNQAQTAAEMFINVDQLEAYRKAQQDVKETIR